MRIELTTLSGLQHRFVTMDETESGIVLLALGLDPHLHATNLSFSYDLEGVAHAMNAVYLSDADEQHKRRGIAVLEEARTLLRGRRTTSSSDAS